MSRHLPAISKHTFLYGLSLALLLVLMNWLEWRFTIINNSINLYIGSIALLFTALGIWLAVQLIKPRKETIIVEKEVFITREVHVAASDWQLDDANTRKKTTASEPQNLGISAREMEVLLLMATGLSNQEIAEQLFVSLNTVKTHASNLFLKLDVKRRTQAVDKARRTGLIP